MKLFRNHDTSTITINGIRNNIRIIQHNLCNVVPTSAILEIVSLMDYEEIDFKSDIFRSLQITIDNINVESVNSIPSKEDQLLDLKYDIRLYRRTRQREAKCINTFYFTGKDNGMDGLKEYYKLTFTCRIKINTIRNTYDGFLMECCYQYAKYLLETPYIQAIVKNPINLPVSYGVINEEYIERYDGYIQYKCCNPMKYAPIDTKKVDDDSEIQYMPIQKNHRKTDKKEETEEKTDEVKPSHNMRMSSHDVVGGYGMFTFKKKEKIIFENPDVDLDDKSEETTEENLEENTDKKEGK